MLKGVDRAFPLSVAIIAQLVACLIWLLDDWEAAEGFLLDHPVWHVPEFWVSSDVILQGTSINRLQQGDKFIA